MADRGAMIKTCAGNEWFNTNADEIRALVDAATGECERGYCDVADMVVNQRWADDIPVYVLSDRVSGS